MKGGDMMKIWAQGNPHRGFTPYEIKLLMMLENEIEKIEQKKEKANELIFKATLFLSAFYLLYKIFV